jgi:hypothetical protein
MYSPCRCAICRKQLLYSFLVIGFHANKEHKLKLEEYRQRYMRPREEEGQQGCLCKCSLCGRILALANMRKHFRQSHSQVHSAKGLYTFLKKIYCR